MQANNVNQAHKRLSSDEIKRNYTQITGREALERLLAGEEVFSAKWADSWKIFKNELRTRECDTDGDFEPCTFDVNTILDPEDDDWYVAPPFDARKEMIARPGEWVAKFFDDDDRTWNFIGFSSKKMHAATTNDLRNKLEEVTGRNEVDVPVDEDLDNAIPLDDADLAKLAALKADEKGVNANG